MSPTLKNILFFLLFFTLTLLFYYNTLHSKFVFDFVDLYFDLKNKGWGNLGNFSKGFAPDILSRVIFYGLIESVGLNEKVWFLLSCILHAANALLFFLFVQQLLRFANYTEVLVPSLLSALIFLLSPYQTEVVVWGGAMNYLLVSFFILLHLNLVFYWTVSKSKKVFYLALLSFLPALFSHEWGLFLLPADILILVLAGNTSNKKSLLFTGGVMLFIGFYFFNQSLSGKMIGHYGAETHLRFKVDEIVPAFYRYILKATLLPSFVFEKKQDLLYGFLQKQKVVLALVVASLSTLLLLGFLFFKNKQRNTPLILFALLFCLFVFPVLNLYFPYWIKIHGDRYCYLPLAFLYAAVISVLFRFKTVFRILLPTAIIIGSAICLAQNNKSWNAAAQLMSSLEEKFPADTTKHYYVLNLPDNFNGAYMFRSLGDSKIARHVNMKTGVDRTKQITELLSYNLQTKSDSIFVTKIDSTQLKVELSHWGNWWWMSTLSASDYEDENVKLDVDDYNHAYVVTFKRKNENDIFLYQAGNEWHQVKNF